MPARTEHRCVPCSHQWLRLSEPTEPNEGFHGVRDERGRRDLRRVGRRFELGEQRPDRVERLLVITERHLEKA